MATLSELMAEFLPGASQEGHSKEAAAKPASTAEIDRVLEDLGLAGAESVKTASENVSETKTNGGSMNLMDIYNEVVGTEQTPAAEVVNEEGTEKVASEQVDENHPITQFGGLVGDYFNVMFESMTKEAGDLEAEAGKGESPVAHQDGGGSMSSVIGKPADANMPVNHSASSGAPLHVTTKNTSPYSLNVVQQKLLKRLGAGIVGEQKQ